MPSEGGGVSGAFINLRVFRRENHFLHPLGECPPSARGDRLRTYSNAPCILHGSPHGVARNNHRRLLRGHGSNLHALRSRYISSPFGSPRKLLSLLFIFFILPAGESRFKNWSRNRYLFSRFHSSYETISLFRSIFNKFADLSATCWGSDEREGKKAERPGYFRRKRRRWLKIRKIPQQYPHRVKRDTGS